ncbi:MAG: FHA domain-containing protein, partial [Oscillospiraceae bacterium]
NWETSIGRSRSCDISLKYGTVSRFHAVLALRKDGWFIFDTESKTGVYLNGEKITEFASVSDGDTLSFGNSVMKFQSNGYGEKAGEEQEGINDFTNATRLVNLADKSAFYLKGPCLIGRDRHCNICLNMPDISESHAKIFLTRDGWMLTDLNSQNGTLINSDKVFGTFPLYDGDVITVGRYKFMFRE